jgi:rSAM/selenodomain-associated transferase 2
MPPLVSIVTPVLADTASAALLLAQLPASPEIEMILVDGGHDARLGSLAAGHPNARILHTAPGRGRQMNTGAAEASGEWLLFLHADSQLPQEWLLGFARLSDSIVGGWFRFALDDTAWQARVIEGMVEWRVRWFRLAYGDQGLFVRRRVFRTLGGFREWPLMEDVEFVRRLVRAGPVLELPLALRTSSRAWRRDGWLRRSTVNTLLVVLYFAGVSPARLADWYRSSARQ